MRPHLRAFGTHYIYALTESFKLLLAGAAGAAAYNILRFSEPVAITLWVFLAALTAVALLVLNLLKEALERDIEEQEVDLPAYFQQNPK